MDSRRRSLAKALSWRLVALVVTTTVAFAFTGEATFALSVGLVDSLVKIVLYYGHERAWIFIPYGRLRPPNYEI